jgi:hypothetical protein
MFFKYLAKSVKSHIVEVSLIIALTGLYCLAYGTQKSLSDYVVVCFVMLYLMLRIGGDVINYYVKRGWMIHIIICKLDEDCEASLDVLWATVMARQKDGAMIEIFSDAITLAVKNQDIKRLGDTAIFTRDPDLIDCLLEQL